MGIAVYLGIYILQKNLFLQNVSVTGNFFYHIISNFWGVRDISNGGSAPKTSPICINSKYDNEYIVGLNINAW